MNEIKCPCCDTTEVLKSPHNPDREGFDRYRCKTSNYLFAFDVKDGEAYLMGDHIPFKKIGCKNMNLEGGDGYWRNLCTNRRPPFLTTPDLYPKCLDKQDCENYEPIKSSNGDSAGR